MKTIEAPDETTSCNMGDIPSLDELSQEAWQAIKAVLPAELPSNIYLWLQSRLCLLIWSTRTGHLIGQVDGALEDSHMEALNDVVKLSDKLWSTVLSLPFDIQDYLEALIRERLPTDIGGHANVAPLNIVMLLPKLSDAARELRDNALRSRKTRARRASSKAAVSEMAFRLEEVVEWLEHALNTPINRKSFFNAVRSGLPADIRGLFPASYDAQRKLVNRMRRGRRNGH